MSYTEQNKPKEKPITLAILFGIISIVLYAVLLVRQDMLNAHFAKGGMFAFLPIITAFIFSYVHGNFTGHFWTVLGVEASKKKRELK
jgi:F0F1-type ATP synthase assembly protein I